MSLLRTLNVQNSDTFLRDTWKAFNSKFGPQ